MFDDKEVFTDIVNPDNTLRCAKYKTVIYSRTHREFFNKNSTFTRTSEVTAREIEIHKPNLPLRLNCFKEIFWSHEEIYDIHNFTTYLRANNIYEKHLSNLNTNKVVIFPLGQQLSIKKPVLLENSVGFFSGIELLFRCFQIQREYVKKEKTYFSRFRLIRVGREEKRLNGIGLYRSGIKGNIPSYYLGGYVSLGELESDDSFIV
ncbi:hypothetical protein [Ferruginibacter sp.]|nr:hypothetical protein [Ferruginibacter sp.]